MSARDYLDDEEAEEDEIIYQLLDKAEEWQSEVTDEKQERFLAARRVEGLKIEAATAEVKWSRTCITDPYEIFPNLPNELKCISLGYFARRPGSEVWVWFGDLPADIRWAFWDEDKLRVGLFEMLSAEGGPDTGAPNT